MALSGRGIDEWVDVPRAVRTMFAPPLSAVEMLDVLHLPGLVLDDPAALVEGELAVDLRPVRLGQPRVLYCAPSSSASARKITSRASGTLFSASIMTARANTAMPPLKSMAPRP